MSKVTELNETKLFEYVIMSQSVNEASIYRMSPFAIVDNL